MLGQIIEIKWNKVSLILSDILQGETTHPLMLVQAFPLCICTFWNTVSDSKIVMPPHMLK